MADGFHIAAWHGIHEDRGEKDAYDFFDLNARGTFEVFEAAASAGAVLFYIIKKLPAERPRAKILISSDRSPQ